MPLIRFDMIQGRNAEEIRALLDATHRPIALWSRPSRFRSVIDTRSFTSIRRSPFLQCPPRSKRGPPVAGEAPMKQDIVAVGDNDYILLAEIRAVLLLRD